MSRKARTAGLQFCNYVCYGSRVLLSLRDEKSPVCKEAFSQA